MSVDVPAATAFVATHGRMLERRRLDLLVNKRDASGVLAALDAYRNPDGGYGWGLEPDLRSPESQPVAAMHALEVLAEVMPAATPRPVELCDWLDTISDTEGGLPFALPVDDPAGCASWWLNSDTTASLQITAQVAANAHEVARHDRGVADHPWLAGATRWCLTAIAALDTAPSAHELLFAIRFLDAVSAFAADAVPLLATLGRYLPDDGVVPVQGGAEGEALRPLDFAPRPTGAARRLFPDVVIADDLRRLGNGQQPDGGWTVAFVSASPAAALEWRAYATVNAIAVLREHERSSSS